MRKLLFLLMPLLLVDPDRAAGAKSESKTHAKAGPTESTNAGLKKAAPKSAAAKPEKASKAAPKSTTPSSTPKKSPVPASIQGSLADHLERQLGKGKFHRRSEWARPVARFKPDTSPPRVWKPIGTVKYLTIHHAEGVPMEHPAAMIRNIYSGHTARNGHLGGSADVAYHFFVDRNGEVWEGRDGRKLGSHVGSRPRGLNNVGNIGICGLGAFMNESPTKAMREGVIRLSAALSKYYGRPLTVRGHKDWVGINGYSPHGEEECPGRLNRVVTAAQTEVAKVNKKEVAAAPTKRFMPDPPGSAIGPGLPRE